MKQKTLHIQFICGFILSIFVSSCGGAERNYYDSKIVEKPISIHRFDLDLIHLDTTNIEESLDELYKKYPDFMPVFLENILGIPAYDTAYIAANLPLFLNDTLFSKVNREVVNTFSDINQIEYELGNAWQRLLHFYPKTEQPEFYFFVSGFANGFTMHNNIIAVGSDLYLGSDYPYYNQVVYQYMKYGMRPECIPIDLISAHLFKNFRINSKRLRLLDDMIYRGKLIYFLSVLFPDTDANEIIGYTKEQWDWCKKYEREIWNTLLDSKHIFSTDQRIIASYMNDAPFTAEISNESPGRLGTWIGMQIAKNYMNNNRNVSMQTLLENTDAQSILENSKYRP